MMDVYSPSKEGVYCIYCVVFVIDGLGTLAIKPLTDTTHATT